MGHIKLGVLNMGLRLLVVISFIKTIDASKQCSEPTASVTGHYLKNHVISTSPSSDLPKCLQKCSDEFRCKSFNFRLTDMSCELNDADRYTHPEDYGPHRNYVYSDTPVRHRKRGGYKSCAEILEENQYADNGYYWVSLGDRDAQVYCDMKSYGGGWTLVVGISDQNNDHLLADANECLNSVLCVPYKKYDITARKLKDSEIHQLAAYEGTFRVDARSPNVTAFYQIPSGPENFMSSCVFKTCPRIIVSHSFPYAWETNTCTTTSVGYRVISSCNRVFDSIDDDECGGSRWKSSLFSSRRVLYAYPCPQNPRDDSLGIYKERQGMLYVK